MTERTDAIIIGGGPAGLAAAITLRARGLSCIVADQGAPSIDKACGEGLMPDALESLGRLGVSITRREGSPFSGIRFLDTHNRVDSTFPNGLGMGVRRTTLHRLLVQAAENAGATLLWNTKPVFVDENKVLLGRTMVRSKWLIGADGQSSRVRQLYGMNAAVRLDTRYGLRRHYQVDRWTDHVEVHWADNGQMYVTPVGADEICVAFVTRDSSLRFDDALTAFPELTERLKGAVITSKDRGSLTTTRKLKSVYHRSTVLIGDASGSVDALTGEGMAMGFRQAVALADAIKQGDLSLYQQAHDGIMQLPNSMASMLLLLDRYPMLRRRALGALSASPQVFSNLLSVHVGEEPFWKTAIKEAPRLSWHLLRSTT